MYFLLMLGPWEWGLWRSFFKITVTSSQKPYRFCLMVLASSTDDVAARPNGRSAHGLGPEWKAFGAATSRVMCISTSHLGLQANEEACQDRQWIRRRPRPILGQIRSRVPRRKFVKMIVRTRCRRASLVENIKSCDP